jgi:metal-responsive CopG/Arc/MetJ family transcriptional regulator
MKTAISLPESLFQSAERLAKRLRIPRSRLYAQAIERYVAESEDSNITAQLNEVYANGVSDLDPTLAALQTISIPRDGW